MNEIPRINRGIFVQTGREIMRGKVFVDDLLKRLETENPDFLATILTFAAGTKDPYSVVLASLSAYRVIELQLRADNLAKKLPDLDTDTRFEKDP